MSIAEVMRRVKMVSNEVVMRIFAEVAPLLR
jgi:hypothetical protein